MAGRVAEKIVVLTLGEEVRKKELIVESVLNTTIQFSQNWEGRESRRDGWGKRIRVRSKMKCTRTQALSHIRTTW